MHLNLVPSSSYAKYVFPSSAVPESVLDADYGRCKKLHTCFYYPILLHKKQQQKAVFLYKKQNCYSSFCVIH